MKNAEKPFEKLVEIMARLRGPGGCPWDKEQTHQTILPYLLEEAHETAEAIDENDFEGLKEELGDLLTQIVFHAQMAREAGRFDIHDVIGTISEKLIRRHPHVFGKEKVSGTQEVLENWEKIKQVENKHKRESLLDGIPKTVPALIKAFRLGEKAGRVGFDWPDRKGIWKKVKEECDELEKELTTDKGPETTDQKTADEYGDLLFTLANLGRFLHIDPETALRRAADRFTRRFQWIEKEAKKSGKVLRELTAEEWDDFWNRAKTSTQ